MKTVKFFILILSMFVSTNALADNFMPAKLIFGDGKILKGQVKPPDPSDTKIEFRLNEKAEKANYESESIKTLIIYFQNDTLEYERLKTYNFTKKKIYPASWLIVLERGYATLYYAYTPGGIGASGQFTSSDRYWLCYRPKEEAASIVSYVGGMNGNAYFKAKAPEYFGDFPELAEKIKNKTYTYKDIFEVVKKYNQWKKKK
jgi:hypothetical protein